MDFFDEVKKNTDFALEGQEEVRDLYGAISWKGKTYRVRIKRIKDPSKGDHARSLKVDDAIIEDAPPTSENASGAGMSATGSEEPIRHTILIRDLFKKVNVASVDAERKQEYENAYGKAHSRNLDGGGRDGVRSSLLRVLPGGSSENTGEGESGSGAQGQGGTSSAESEASQSHDAPSSDTPIQGGTGQIGKEPVSELEKKSCVKMRRPGNYLPGRNLRFQRG